MMRVKTVNRGIQLHVPCKRYHFFLDIHVAKGAQENQKTTREPRDPTKTTEPHQNPGTLQKSHKGHT